MPTIRQLTCYGFPIHYRIEHRADGNVFVFSYREEVEGRMELVYEHPPRRIPKLERLLEGAESTGVWTDDDGKTILEQLPERVMDEFFRCFLDTESSPEIRAIGLERRRSVPELTLGALLAADRAKLVPEVSEATKKSRSPESIADDRRTISRLGQKAGQLRWHEATPEHCVAWLQEESEHMRRACGRIMKRVFIPFFEMEEIDDLLGWEDFDPTMGIPSKPQFDGLIRKNVLPNMLSYGQCRTLVEKFFSSAGPKAVSGVDMALLLKLSLKMETEEICALNMESFVKLKDFSERMTVHVTHLYCEELAGGRHQIQEIEDPHQLRIILPVTYNLRAQPTANKVITTS